MRGLIVVVMVMVAGRAWAEEPKPEAKAEPQAVRGEVIVIEDAPPTPKVKAKPKKRYLGTGSHLDNILLRPAPEYSDRAIESDAWRVAWMLLDINEKGAVTRVKFLKYPGYDLEAIAVKEAMKLSFEPAIALDGKPIRSWIVWPIEWPSYGWMVKRVGTATGIPDTSHVPCRGKAPLHMGSVHPTYRDCDPPDWKRMNTEAWRTK